VAEAPARLHVVRPHWMTEQLRPSAGWRQKTRQHFHRGRLAAAVRAEEAEDLAATNAEAHMVHGREIAEPTGEPFGLDGGHVVVVGRAWAYDHLLVPCARVFRQQSDEGRLQGRLASPL